MSFAYYYDPEKRLLRIIGRGVVSIGERVDTVHCILGDHELPDKCNILINVNEVRNAPEGSDITLVGDLTRKLQARFGGRVGIVNTKVGHLRASHLVALWVKSSNDNVRVFLSESEAHAWLAT